MAGHSTILVLPLIVLVLVSGMVEEEMKNGQSLWKKTSSILSTENLTKEQISSLNQMISKFNENIQIYRGERTMEEFKSNDTAVKQMAAETVKEDLHMFNLTEKEGMYAIACRCISYSRSVKYRPVPHLEES